MAIANVRLPIRSIPLLLLLVSASTAAHVTWIEPSAYRAGPGDRVTLTLRVGEEFAGNSLLYIPEWFIRFSRFHAGEEIPVDGNMGDDPAGNISIGTPGSYLVLYENKPDFVELEAEKFATYLRNNGLEHIIEKREALGESGYAMILLDNTLPDGWGADFAMEQPHFLALDLVEDHAELFAE